MLTRTLSVVALSLVGCGYTSPGGGTQTLYVVARLSSDGSTDGSRARVTVRQGSSSGELVANAQVVLQGGPLAKTVVPWDDGANQYRLDGLRWVDAFRLEVTRGSDQLDGAIDAPGATLITSPIAGSTFRKSDARPLSIRWTDNRNAVATLTQVRLDRAQVDRALPAGSSELQLEASILTVGTERVRVERTNEVTLAGGAAGSLLSAQTNHELDFRVE